MTITEQFSRRAVQCACLVLRNRNSRGALGLLFRGLLGSASSRHDIDDVHVAFAAGVLEKGPLGGLQRNNGRPGLRPRGGIVNGKTVLNPVSGHSLEAFGDLESFGIGVTEGSFRPEI